MMASDVEGELRSSEQHSGSYTPPLPSYPPSKPTGAAGVRLSVYHHHSRCVRCVVVVGGEDIFLRQSGAASPLPGRAMPLCA